MARRFRWVFAAVVAVVLGGVAVVHFWAPTVVSDYKLPWAAGVRHAVMQGNYLSQDIGGCVSGCGTHGCISGCGTRGCISGCGTRGCISGCGTHNDDAMRYAWDFDLPEGTKVLAARGGTVALMNGNWRSDHCGGTNESEAGPITSQLIGNEANFVEIAHGDGTSALYLHLSEVAPEIERKAVTGEPVLQGELLGLSGKTGYTQCVPHLHFQVENSVKADWFTTSLPISFADPDVVSRTPLGVPEEGQAYVSDNIPVSAAP